MNKLILFPVFVLFIFAVMSMGINYDSYANGTYYFENGSQPYGFNYQILSNGTIVFENPDLPVVLYGWTWWGGKGDILFTIPFSDINQTSVNYTYDRFTTGRIYFNNGSYITTGWDGWNYVTWSYVDFSWKGNITYLQYLIDYCIIGTSTSGLWTLGSVTLPITTGQGIMLGFVSIVTAIGLIGIRVFGTGLEYGLEIIKGVVYLALWGILSIIAQPMLSAIFFIGTIFYLGLTVMYLLGFVTSLGGGSG